MSDHYASDRTNDGTNVRDDNNTHLEEKPTRTVPETQQCGAVFRKTMASTGKATICDLHWGHEGSHRATDDEPNPNPNTGPMGPRAFASAVAKLIDTDESAHDWEDRLEIVAEALRIYRHVETHGDGVVEISAAQARVGDIDQIMARAHRENNEAVGLVPRSDAQPAVIERKLRAIELGAAKKFCELYGKAPYETQVSVLAELLQVTSDTAPPPVTDHRSKWRAMQKEIYDTAVSKGWYENPPNFGERIALMHSELSEALESYRKGETALWSEDGKPEGYGVELADVVIRILDYCEHLNIDLESMIRIKMTYNKTRPYKHGGKKI